MNALLLRGGSRVEPGAYREVRTGHVVYTSVIGLTPVSRLVACSGMH
jgi:hypothetical protein